MAQLLPHTRRGNENHSVSSISPGAICCFPPAAHFSCTGMGAARTQKLGAVSAAAGTGVNQPLAGETPDRRGARGVWAS